MSHGSAQECIAALQREQLRTGLPSNSAGSQSTADRGDAERAHVRALDKSRVLPRLAPVAERVVHESLNPLSCDEASVNPTGR